MASSKDSMPAGTKPKNKLRRQSAYLTIKKTRGAAKRDERFKRKREEAKNPSLREERLAHNIPVTIDSKRTWDNENLGDEGDALGWAIDVERLAKKRKLEEEAAARGEDEEEDGEDGLLEKLKKRDAEAESDDDEDDEEVDSMLDSDSEAEDFSDDGASDSDSAPSRSKRKPDPPKRAASPMSTATNMDISPEFLKQKFPAVYNRVEEPKILVTTSINATIHPQAQTLSTFFPNATYVRRSAHAHAHKYSVREIAGFAHNRGYSALVILMQAHHAKEPDGLDIVLLPSGPHFHFSISNWVDGKKLPGHGV